MMNTRAPDGANKSMVLAGFSFSQLVFIHEVIQTLSKFVKTLLVICLPRKHKHINAKPIIQKTSNEEMQLKEIYQG